MYNDTVTLFNRYSNRQGDTWYPSVLRNVHLNMDKAAILAKYGPESQDSAVLNVRYAKNGQDLIVGDKPWRPPKEWAAQTNDILPGSLTFSGGQLFDFFWVGEWPDEAPISGSDYTEGFYNYMNDRYDYVFAVSSVGGPYTVIPHFEIMGK